MLASRTEGSRILLLRVFDSRDPGTTTLRRSLLARSALSNSYHPEATGHTVSQLVKWSVHARLGVSYIFYRIFHKVSGDEDIVRLSNTMNTGNCLLLELRIPMGLENMHEARCGHVNPGDRLSHALWPD